MKKLFIFILGLLLFSFSYGDSEYTAYIKKVNSIENFIGNTTQAVNYDFDIYIEPRNSGNVLDEAYFIPKSPTENEKISMTLGIIKVIDGRNINGNFYFPIDNKNSKVDDLKLKATGKITLKTSFENLKGSGRIELGEVQEKNHRRKVWLTFDYGILEKEDTINIRVVKNMDLGVAIAGQTLKTSNPAIVEISGIKNETIKVELDKSTIIKNDRNDELTVNLSFKDKDFEEKRDKKVKEINSTNGSEEIKIEGISQTYNSTPSGIYKGYFKVRVIY